MTTEEMVKDGIYKFLGRSVTLKDKIDVFKSKLDYLEFLSYLEEISNVKFDPKESEKFETFEDIRMFILQKMI